MDYPHIKERERDRFVFVRFTCFFNCVEHVKKYIRNVEKKCMYKKKGGDPHLKLKPTDTTFVIMILFFKSLNG